MDELDYYQILHLEPTASQSDIKRAYFETSRVLHPDANRHLEEEVQVECMRISKRITEAYCVLRNPRSRTAYDAQRSQEGSGIRMQLADAKASHVKNDNEKRQGKTPQGRQFYQKAAAAIERKDNAAVISNLQMALTFEPDNSLFKDRLAEAKAEAKAEATARAKAASR
jgi:DnaJ-class molecular chaperone